MSRSPDHSTARLSTAVAVAQFRRHGLQRRQRESDRRSRCGRRYEPEAGHCSCGGAFRIPQPASSRPVDGRRSAGLSRRGNSQTGGQRNGPLAEARAMHDATRTGLRVGRVRRVVWPRASVVHRLPGLMPVGPSLLRGPRNLESDGSFADRQASINGEVGDHRAVARHESSVWMCQEPPSVREGASGVRLAPSGGERSSAGPRCRGPKHLCEVAGATPHGPVPCGEVHDVDDFETRDLGKHGVTRLGQFHHLCARD